MSALMNSPFSAVLFGVLFSCPIVKFENDSEGAGVPVYRLLKLTHSYYTSLAILTYHKLIKWNIRTV